MNNLLIQKASMKFTIEVVPCKDHMCFNVIRYIEVGRNESMEGNAKLAKHEALQINGHFVNCNDLVRSAIEGMELKLLPHTIGFAKKRKITLKKSPIFGF